MHDFATQRSGEVEAESFASVRDVVQALQPDHPVYCLFPDNLKRAAALFRKRSGPVDLLYAVKCNSEPSVLAALVDGGVKGFDVASLVEIERVKSLFPELEAFFMHPVKARSDIRSAYFDHGVRVFAIDHRDELKKILEETGGARDITLVVRFETESEAVYQLSSKFGANAETASCLLRMIADAGCKTGLTFHVGSQLRTTGAFRAALEKAGEISRASGIPLDFVDLGGGFPVRYDAEGDAVNTNDGLHAPLFLEIAAGLAALPDCGHPRLVVEPGRALAATGLSILTRILHRRENSIYISDSVWGNLSDAWTGNFELSTRHFPRADIISPAASLPFKVFGFSCGPMDVLPRPFMLPANIREGDWIEIRNMGAYSSCLKSSYNGFKCDQTVTVEG